MISIIIPIFNTPINKLKKCINSVLNQNYKDFEIIIVNDCSTNSNINSFLQHISNKDSRIRYINKVQNGGIEKARFTGIERAKGNYLMFMDHDDLLMPKALATMINNIKQTDADVVQGKCSDKFGPINKLRNIPLQCGIINQPELREKYYCSFFGVNIIPVEVWGKLYKMSTIRKAALEPKGLTYTDDNCFNMFLFPHVKTLSIIDSHVYTHRYGGYSSKYTGNSLTEYKKLYQIKKEAISKFNYPYANKFIDIEMKNILEFDIRKRITSGKHAYSQIKEFLDLELKDKLWDNVKHTLQNNPTNDIFCQALINKDAELLYKIVKTNVSSIKYKTKSLFISIIKSFIRFIS